MRPAHEDGPDAGDRSSAIALDDLCNDLAGERDFKLLSAYPMASFAHVASGDDFRRICGRHSTVIPSEDYAVLGGADAQQRAVAQLQQKTAALAAEVARLRANQINVELDYIQHLAASSAEGVVRRTWDRPQPGHGRKANARVHDSPGGRLLRESLQTLSSRLAYAD